MTGLEHLKKVLRSMEPMIWRGKRKQHPEYLRALDDVRELLENAAANDFLNHTYDELVDQLIMLKDEPEGDNG